MSPYILWLAAGVVFFALEALGANGIGFLFAGMGALSVGAWLKAAPETPQITQYIVFFAATALWTVLLWKPLQQFRIKKSSGYNNIIGETAYIGGSGLRKGETGEATWSGTIMKAELSGDCTVESLAGGAQAIIVAVNGNTLIVKPKI